MCAPFLSIVSRHTNRIIFRYALQRLDPFEFETPPPQPRHHRVSQSFARKAIFCPTINSSQISFIILNVSLLVVCPIKLRVYILIAVVLIGWLRTRAKENRIDPEGMENMQPVEYLVLNCCCSTLLLLLPCTTTTPCIERPSLLIATSSISSSSRKTTNG